MKIPTPGERVAIFGTVALASVIAFSAPTRAAEIDFEGLAVGTIVDELASGAGVTGFLGGVIGVNAFNPALGSGNNAAVIFDSSNPPSFDLDLGTPNEDFGGPGVGIGGEAGEFQNDTALGNILIVNEAREFVDRNGDGVINGDDSPVLRTDDAFLSGEFVDFDFSTTKKNGKGTVTVNSITIMDIERGEGPTGDAVQLSGPGMPTAFFSIPFMGDNGVALIGPIGLAGVAQMRVNLNGSGAIASVVINEEQEGVCWITTGGFYNAGVQSGGKDFTFGGNVGPPPSGALQVIDHTTGDNFHTNDVHIVDCEVIDRTGPGQPGGKKGFQINKATFEGTGRLNGEDGFPFTGFVIDAGEPPGKKGNDSDFFEIVVTDPGTSLVVFEASGELDGGNVQIHPPNPSL